jgi:hypothetical protein
MGSARPEQRHGAQRLGALHWEKGPYVPGTNNVKAHSGFEAKGMYWLIEELPDGYHIRRPGMWTDAEHWTGLDALAAQAVLFHLTT